MKFAETTTRCGKSFLNSAHDPEIGGDDNAEVVVS
jgi:hypothetical protein